jgi:hypothetical protein
VSGRSALRWALPVPAVLALAACGGGTAARDAAHPPPVQRLTNAELAVQLGNGFRHALYRLAVMSQPGDDATDLGQALPTGTVRDVRCASRSCTVRWKTVQGHRAVTRYRIEADRRGCFYATAQPALPERYDATIATYSEHPLNTLQSARRGC